MKNPIASIRIAVCLIAVQAALAVHAQAESPTLRVLSPHLAVSPGPINVGILHDGEKALLFDCAEAPLEVDLKELGVSKVERICFTHHHRDQTCGAAAYVAGGAEVWVSEAEKPWFDDVASFWNDPARRWGVYNFHPHRLMRAEPLPVAQTVKPGETFSWGPARITVLATPGHTDAAVSYLVKVDGIAAVFSGDTLYDEGRIWDLHSLQHGNRSGSHTVGDYHGFLGARREVFDSLKTLAGAQADFLIPSHGRVMEGTETIAKACRAVGDRIEACYDRYAAVSALRHYFPAYFAEFAGAAHHMEFAPHKEVPACLRHFSTTWVLISDTKHALVMDCSGQGVVDQVKKLLDEGEIEKVDGIWVTHYHNDHTAGINALQEAFGCPVLTDESVASVITNPLGWRLPCVDAGPITVEQVKKEGQSWKWHEFTLTAFTFPGQTLYHAGLLVEGHGAKMFFVGDSFTPAGMDDYCAQNRNWLGAGVGFNRCLDLLERLQPTHLFNPHVDPAWEFSAEQYAFMRENLAKREAEFGALFPWEYANFGMDEWWVRCFPYEIHAARGETVEFEVIVTNHATGPKPAECRAVLSSSWSNDGTRARTQWSSVTVPPKQDARMRVVFAIPKEAKAGRLAIPVDIRFDGRELPRFTELVLEVK